MVKAKIYNMQGKEVAEKLLSEDIFGLKFNPQVVTQAINTQLANKRRPIAHTKNRGEVRGGGRKPFRQKGTGNARAGSTRSPIWIGGGVTFGPRNNRNFSKRIPQKIVNSALRMALSQKTKEKKVIILEKFDLPEISTKQVENVFQNLPIQEGKILVILPKINVNLELSVANLPYLKTIQAENINIVDLVKYDYLVVTAEGLEKIGSILGKKQKKEVK